MGQVLLAAIARWPEYNASSIKRFAHLIITLNGLAMKWPIITKNVMTVDDEIEVGRILAKTDIPVPDSFTEVLGAVALPQYTLYAQRGRYLERGTTVV